VQKQIPAGDNQKGKGKGKSNSKSKGNSRFPAGMTERKATAEATATTEAGHYGMTNRKARATAKTTAGPYRMTSRMGRAAA
jgi:hypothetical protein